MGVVQVAREMGLARFGKLSVDGTKVRANASKRKAMSYERMGKEAARLQAEIEALLTKAGIVRLRFLEIATHYWHFVRDVAWGNSGSFAHARDVRLGSVQNLSHQSCSR